MSLFPSPALLPKGDPWVQTRQCCSCFLSPRENSLLHRESFYLWHSCFQPLQLIPQLDLPTSHAKFHARLFISHNLPLLIATISEKWLNTWLLFWWDAGNHCPATAVRSNFIFQQQSHQEGETKLVIWHILFQYSMLFQCSVLFHMLFQGQY